MSSLLASAPRHAKDIIHFVLAVALGLSFGAAFCGMVFSSVTLGVFLVGLAGLLVWLLSLGLWAVFYGLGWL